MDEKECALPDWAESKALPDWAKSAALAIDWIFSSVELNRSEANHGNSPRREFLQYLTHRAWFYLSLTFDKEGTAEFQEDLALLHEHLLAVFTYINRVKHRLLTPRFGHNIYASHCHVFVALLLANKYIHDFSYPSAWWLLFMQNSLPLNLEDLKVMELEMLDWMNWKLAISREERERFDCIISAYSRLISPGPALPPGTTAKEISRIEGGQSGAWPSGCTYPMITQRSRPQGKNPRQYQTM